MSEYKPLTCLPVLPLRGLVVFPCIDSDRIREIVDAQKLPAGYEAVDLGGKYVLPGSHAPAYRRRCFPNSHERS